MNMEVKKIKEEIFRLDLLLDEDSTSNEDFDRINLKIRELYIELAKAEKREEINNIKEIRVNSWYEKFLSSFKKGTQKITNRQAECFSKLNRKQPFIWDGRIYSCPGPNYRTGFSMVEILEREEA